MDLYTEQHARNHRDVLSDEIRRATALGPHVAAAAPHGRTRLSARALRRIQSTIAPLRDRIETADATTVRNPSLARSERNHPTATA